jgi:hypothetical protein
MKTVMSLVAMEHRMTAASRPWRPQAQEADSPDGRAGA